MSAPDFRPFPTTAEPVGRVESLRNGRASHSSDPSDHKTQNPGGNEGRALRDWLARLPPLAVSAERVGTSGVDGVGPESGEDWTAVDAWLRGKES